MTRNIPRARQAAAITALTVAVAACSPLLRDPSSPVDPKLGLTTYVEEGSLVALVVGTRATRLRGGEAYVPIEVAIVNKGLLELSLTPESFTLVDADGKRYPAVGRDELRRSYGASVDTDRRLGDVGPIVRGRFQSYREIASTLTASFDRPIEQDLNLPRYSYALDFLYFPTPAGGVVGRRFELFMRSPELDEPIFVRFEVTGKGGGKPARGGKR